MTILVNLRAPFFYILALISFPTNMEDPENNPLVPVKTILMLISFTVLLIASFVGKLIWPKYAHPTQDSEYLDPIADIVELEPKN